MANHSHVDIFIHLKNFVCLFLILMLRERKYWFQWNCQLYTVLYNLISEPYYNHFLWVYSVNIGLMYGMTISSYVNQAEVSSPSVVYRYQIGRL